jgi:hypothetical protein
MLVELPSTLEVVGYEVLVALGLMELICVTAPIVLKLRDNIQIISRKVSLN